VTASFGTLAWPPFRVRSARLQVLRSSGQHIPRIKPQGCSKDQNQPLGGLRNICADVIELALNRLLGDGLFHDHRTAAIHLRNRLPGR
jgi:hypothetical protein